VLVSLAYEYIIFCKKYNLFTSEETEIYKISPKIRTIFAAVVVAVILLVIVGI